MDVRIDGNTLTIELTEEERAALARGEPPQVPWDKFRTSETSTLDNLDSDHRSFREMFPQLFDGSGRPKPPAVQVSERQFDEIFGPDPAQPTLTSVPNFPEDPYPGQSIPCRRCHRPLTNVTSKIRGIGPICAGREIISGDLPTEQKVEQLQQLLQEAKQGGEETGGLEALIAQLKEADIPEDPFLDRSMITDQAVNFVNHVFTEVFPQIMPGYEPREPQLRLSREVATAMASGEHVAAEAGTGTGKSLAYLVPAIWWARQHHKPVVITTGTIALQEQLIGKDIPFLQKALQAEMPFKAALVKGKGNFLCRVRAEDEAQKQQGFVQDPDWPRLWEWIRSTDSGDKSTITGWVPPPELWNRVNSDETCTKRDHPDCWIQTAKRKAKDADILVCNHSLYMADVQVRMSSGDGASILPPHAVVVFDEAHHIEDVASESFGSEVSQFKAPQLVRELRRVDHPDIPEREMEQVQQLNDTLFSLFPRVEPRIDKQALRRLDDWPAIQQDMTKLAEVLDAMAVVLDNMDFKHSDEKTKQKVKALYDRAVNLKYTLLEIAGDADPDWVDTVEIDWSKDKPRVTIKRSPISVAPLLREYIWDQVHSAACLSATISSGSSFGYFKRQVGLDQGNKPVRELIVDSPFDYPNQSLLYVPRGLPDPNQETYGTAIQPIIADILRHTEGRAFVLFTSYRQMQAAYKALGPGLQEAGYTVFKQGDRSRSELVAEFKADVHSILFATASFWEGVDVQGEALSCVIIDKIPFDSPGDPLLEARQKAIDDAGGKAFMEFSVPRAVIKLKQGVGRLIRTRSDRGIVAILDNRLRTKPYGRVFLRSLPPMREIFYLDDVPKFLSGEKP